jgi:hypothetical protein
VTGEGEGCYGRNQDRTRQIETGIDALAAARDTRAETVVKAIYRAMADAAFEKLAPLLN